MLLANRDIALCCLQHVSPPLTDYQPASTPLYILREIEFLFYTWFNFCYYFTGGKMLLTSHEKTILETYRTLSPVQKAFALGLAEHENALTHILEQRREFASSFSRLLTTDRADKALLIRR